MRFVQYYVNLNPIPTGGGPFWAPNDLKQSGISTVLWLESPKFMTLFISVSVWSQWSYFWKKELWNFEKLKKKNLPFRHQRVPPLEKKIQKSKNLVFFPKNYTISTWIWILHVLSFLLRYIMSVFLQIFIFSFFIYEISIDYHFHSLTSSGKNSHHRRLFWASMDS